MIPFLVNDLTLAADPIKLYEYFTAGRPVVSARPLLDCIRSLRRP